MSPSRRLTAEGIGSVLLAATVIGSGVMMSRTFWLLPRPVARPVARRDVVRLELAFARVRVAEVVRRLRVVFDAERVVRRAF